MRGCVHASLLVGGETVGALTIYGRDPENLVAQASWPSWPSTPTSSRSASADCETSIGYCATNLNFGRRSSFTHLGHSEMDLGTDRLEFMADELYAIYGIAPGQWPGDFETLRSFVVPSDRPAFERAIDETLTQGSSELVHGIVGQDGTPRMLRTRTELIRGRDGQPERVVGVSLDVTVYVTARQELDQSRQFLLAITNNMAEGMIATDSHGVITFANAAAAKLFHFDAARLIGRPTHEVFASLLQMGRPLPTTGPRPFGDVWADGTAACTLNSTIRSFVQRWVRRCPSPYSASPLGTPTGLQGVAVHRLRGHLRAGELSSYRVRARAATRSRGSGESRDAHRRRPVRAVLAQPDRSTSRRNEVTQHELLIRLASAERRDLLEPRATFLPTAEEFGLVDRDRSLGHRRDGAARGSAGIAVAVQSVRQDPSSTLTPSPANRAAPSQRHGATPASNMECEITETALGERRPRGRSAWCEV